MLNWCTLNFVFIIKLNLRYEGHDAVCLHISIDGAYFRTYSIPEVFLRVYFRMMNGEGLKCHSLWQWWDNYLKLFFKLTTYICVIKLANLPFLSILYLLHVIIFIFFHYQINVPQFAEYFAIMITKSLVL